MVNFRPFVQFYEYIYYQHIVFFTTSWVIILCLKNENFHFSKSFLLVTFRITSSGFIRTCSNSHFISTISFEFTKLTIRHIRFSSTNKQWVFYFGTKYIWVHQKVTFDLLVVIFHHEFIYGDSSWKTWLAMFSLSWSQIYFGRMVNWSDKSMIFNIKFNLTNFKNI
jgi:hypothetical protein